MGAWFVPRYCAPNLLATKDGPASAEGNATHYFRALARTRPVLNVRMHHFPAGLAEVRWLWSASLALQR